MSTPSDKAKSLDEILAEMQAVADKATRGVWRAEITPTGPCGAMCYADAVKIPIRVPTSKPYKLVTIEEAAIFCDTRAVPEWRENLRFIAMSREALPRLIQCLQKAIETIETDASLDSEYVETLKSEIASILQGRG